MPILRSSFASFAVAGSPANARTAAATPAPRNLLCICFPLFFVASACPGLCVPQPFFGCLTPARMGGDAAKRPRRGGGGVLAKILGRARQEPKSPFAMHPSCLAMGERAVG